MKAIKTTITQTGYALYIKALIAGLLVGTASLVILLLVISILLLMSGTLPHDYLIWFDLVACGISVFLCGCVCARIIRSKGIIWGAASGFMMFMIQFLSGLFGADTNISYVTFIKLLIFVLLGAVGGIKGVNKKDKIRIK